MGTELLQGDQYIRSNESAAPDGDKDEASLYGQNGYGGASSDLPGKRTTSGFLPEMEPTKGIVENRGAANWQTRELLTQPPAKEARVPLAYGMKPREYANIGKPVRPVTQPAKR